MIYVLILIAFALLLLPVLLRVGSCAHEFVASDRKSFDDHIDVVYRCERCGIESEGTR